MSPPKAPRGLRVPTEYLAGSLCWDFTGEEGQANHTSPLTHSIVTRETGMLWPGKKFRVQGTNKRGAARNNPEKPTPDTSAGQGASDFGGTPEGRVVLGCYSVLDICLWGKSLTN